MRVTSADPMVWEERGQTLNNRFWEEVRANSCGSKHLMETDQAQLTTSQFELIDGKVTNRVTRSFHHRQEIDRTTAVTTPISRMVWGCNWQSKLESSEFGVDLILHPML